MIWIQSLDGTNCLIKMMGKVIRIILKRLTENFNAYWLYSMVECYSFEEIWKKVQSKRKSDILKLNTLCLKLRASLSNRSFIQISCRIQFINFYIIFSYALGWSNILGISHRVCNSCNRLWIWYVKKIFTGILRQQKWLNQSEMFIVMVCFHPLFR